MDPITIGLILGGLLGGGKAAVGMSNESKDRELTATKWRTSPWTGIKPGEVERANPIGDVASGAAIGGMWGKALTPTPPAPSLPVPPTPPAPVPPPAPSPFKLPEITLPNSGAVDVTMADPFQSDMMKPMRSVWSQMTRRG